MKKERCMLALGWTPTLVRVVMLQSSGEGTLMDSIPLGGTSDQLICDRLRSAWQRCQPCDRVLVAVHRKSVIMRFIDLPSMKENELSSMVQLQMSNYVPYAIHEMVYDMTIVPSIKEGYSRVILTALNKKECTRILDLCTAAGLPLAAMTVSTWGTVAAVHRSRASATMREGATVVIDTDGGVTELIVMHRGALVATRSFDHEPLGTEERKVFIEHLTSEFTHTLETVKREYPLPELAGVMVSETLASYASELNERLKLSVIPVAAGMITDNRQPVREGHRSEPRGSFLSLAGLGGLSDVTAATLLPEEFRQQHARLETRMLRRCALVLGILTIVCSIASLGVPVMQKHGYVIKQERELSKRLPDKTHHAGMLKSMKVIADIKQQQRVPLETLAELYRLIPSTMYLVSADYDEERGVTIRGCAETIAQVSDVLLALQRSPLFPNAEIKFAKQKMFEGREGVDFEIACPRRTTKK